MLTADEVEAYGGVKPELDYKEDGSDAIANIDPMERAIVKQHIERAIALEPIVSVENLAADIYVHIKYNMPSSGIDIEDVRWQIGLMLRSGAIEGPLSFIVKRNGANHVVRCSHLTAEEHTLVSEWQQRIIQDDTKDREQFNLGNAEKHLANSKRVIDAKYGEGYAEKHPELVMAYMIEDARQ